MSRKQPKAAGKIETPKLPLLKLNFSFEYYATLDDKYCLSKFSSIQIKTAMSKLKEISAMTFEELQRNRAVLHFGAVVWEKTIKPDGFGINALKSIEAFHFALLGVNGQLCRVFGAYYQGTFYIVWFDLNHEIWPTKLKNT